MKKELIIAMVCFFTLSVMAPLSKAATFSVSNNCLTVWGEDGNGKIHVEGNADDVKNFVKAVQFCPDQHKGGCGNNYVVRSEFIDPGHAVISLDPSAVKANQRAFNGRDISVSWAPLPHPYVRLGKNVVMEISAPSSDSEDGRGGAHFTYIGDLPAGSYRTLGLVSTGSACGQELKSVLAEPEKAPMSAGDLSGGDNKVSVKGNNNDTTPQNIKQKATQNTKIKGNNNSVVKKQYQTGINAKTTGANSPITIKVYHEGTAPDHDDGTCVKCHANAVKKNDAGSYQFQHSTKDGKEAKKK